MGKKHSLQRRENEGRPTVMTPEVLAKLEGAFMNAFSDEMSCLYAGISVDALYDYCKKNPQFTKRKEELKITPNLAAQKRLVDDAAGTVSGARWWAERRMTEFMPKSKVELGGKVQTESVGPQDEAARALARKYEEEYRSLIAAEAKKAP